MADFMQIPFSQITDEHYQLLLLADPDMDAINSYLQQSRLYEWRMDGILFALFVLTVADPATIELKNIAVKEDQQGKGYGKYSLAESLKTAMGLGYRSMIVGTCNSSISQLYLYQQAGFEIYDIRYNFFTEHYRNPITEQGIPCKHMLMLRKALQPAP